MTPKQIEIIRAACQSLQYACDALQAPSFSAMRENLRDLQTLLATLEESL